MSTSAADYLVDRRRLRRQLGFWRIVAFVVAALAIIALGARFSGAAGFVGGPHIARLTVSGFIAGNDETLKLIREARNSPAVAAALVRIDSPGGGTEGSEEIYDELRRLAAKKPVAAVVGGMAASGAYIAALGADRIFVRGNSIVGSIGVLVEYPNVSGLMDKVGVKLESIKSSPLKAAPNGFEPTSDEARAAMAALIADSFDWFKALVKDRRGLTDEELAKVDDGRVFTGRQGLRAQARRRDRRRTRRDRLAGEGSRRGEEPAGARLQAGNGLDRLEADEPGGRRGRPRRPDVDRRGAALRRPAAG